jgi:hypothetical protein
MIKIHDIPSENLVSILEYLTSIDIVKCTLLDKNLFTNNIITKAVSYHINNINMIIYSKSSSSNNNNNKLYDPNINKANTIEYLRKREIYCILHIINTPFPLNGIGCWISTNWISNTKKYLDSIDSNLCINDKLNKKQNKIKRRRGVEVLLPSSNMMYDINCSHNNLALTNRKRLIDPILFKYLRNHYKEGIIYKNSTKPCPICIDNKEKIKSNEKQIKEIITNTINNTKLADLYYRKSGIPSNFLTSKLTSSLLKESENLQSNILLTEEFNLLHSTFINTSNSDNTPRSIDRSTDNKSLPMDGIENNTNEPQIIDKEMLIKTIKEYEHSLSVNNETIRNISHHQPLIPGLYNIISR